jgi:hypothetical protein
VVANAISHLPMQVGEFFDYMYGSQKGYAYSPIKDPMQTSPLNWTQHFFKWPEQRQELVNHVETNKEKLEVYYSPSLFSRPSSKKRFFENTRFVWAEFDGELPTPEKLTDVPEPTLKIRSSTSNHEHWYWELDEPVQSIPDLENITSCLAYHLGADLGVWDASRVLRPPGTLHQESRRRVTVLSRTPKTYDLEDFSNLPKPPSRIPIAITNALVPVEELLAVRYRWDSEDYKFFSKPGPMPKGVRSSALTRLGHICMEMGMTDNEALSVLLNADNRWKKFYGRNDQIKRLAEMVSHCRAKYGQSPISETFPTYGFKDILKGEFKQEWLIPGLITKAGLVVVSSAPKVGKTQFCVRMGMSLATGENFLNWPVERAYKFHFFSMEMSAPEVKYILTQMIENQTPEQVDMLQKNFQISPLGHMITLNKKHTQDELLRKLEEVKPDVILLDSLGVSIGDNIKDDEVILETFDFINRYIRADLGITVIFVHHNRKAQGSNQKPKGLDDLYGSQYIGAQATSIIGLWRDKGFIEINNLGQRLAEDYGTLVIKREPGLNFTIVESKEDESKRNIPAI